MNTWKRPREPAGCITPMPFRPKRPKLVRPPEIKAKYLSQTYDWALYLYVSGFYLRGLLLHFVQNVFPVIRRNGPSMTKMEIERITKFIDSFLYREWSAGRIPLLSSGVSLNKSDVQSKEQNLSQTCSENNRKTLEGGTNQAKFLDLEKKTATVVSSEAVPIANRHSGDSKAENQFLDEMNCISTTRMCTRSDKETQTCVQLTGHSEESTRFGLCRLVTGGKDLYRAESVDCSAQTPSTWMQEVDRTLSQPLESNDEQTITRSETVPTLIHRDATASEQSNEKNARSVNVESRNVRSEEEPDQTSGDSLPCKQPAERADSHELSNCFLQVNNFIQLTGPQTENKIEQNGFQKPDPVLHEGNSCLPHVPVEDLKHSHTKVIASDEHDGGSRAQSGRTFSTDNTAQTGNSFSPNSTARSTESPQNGRNIPLKINSAYALDPILRKKHFSRGLVQNNRSFGKVTLTADFRHGGLRSSPNRRPQAFAGNAAFPRNTPRPAHIYGWPRPRPAELKWTVFGGIPQGLLPANHQCTGTSLTSSKEAQGISSPHLAPMTQGYPTQPVSTTPHMFPGVFRGDQVQPCGNLIQLTGSRFDAMPNQTNPQTPAASCSASCGETKCPLFAGPHDASDFTGTAPITDPSNVTPYRKLAAQSSAAPTDNLVQVGCTKPVGSFGFCPDDTGSQLTTATSNASLSSAGFQMYPSAMSEGLLARSGEAGNTALSSIPSDQVQGNGTETRDTNTLLFQTSLDQARKMSTADTDSIPLYSEQTTAAWDVRHETHALDVSSEQLEFSNPIQANHEIAGTSRDPRTANMLKVRGRKPAVEEIPLLAEKAPSETLYPLPPKTLEQRGTKPVEAVDESGIFLQERSDDARGLRTHGKGAFGGDTISLTTERMQFFKDTKQTVREQMDTVCTSASAQQIPSADGKETNTLSDEISLQDKQCQGLLRQADVHSHSSGSAQSVDGSALSHLGQVDKVCKTSSTNQNFPRAFVSDGRVPSLDEIPLPGGNVYRPSLQNRKRSTQDNKTNQETNEGSETSSEQTQNSSVSTSAAPASEQLQTTEQPPTSEKGNMSREQIQILLVDRLQQLVGHLTKSYTQTNVSLSRSPLQESDSRNTNENAGSTVSQTKESASLLAKETTSGPSLSVDGADFHTKKGADLKSSTKATACLHSQTSAGPSANSGPTLDSTSPISELSKERTSSERICNVSQDNRSPSHPVLQKDSSQTRTFAPKASSRSMNIVRYVPYPVKDKCPNPVESARDKDITTAMESLIMHEVPKLIRDRSNVSDDIISKQCALFISGCISTLMGKGVRKHANTETDPPRTRNRWTMTSRPQRLNRRIMTDAIQMRDRGTVTDIIGRREMTTLTDNRRLKDAWTISRGRKPAPSRSSQTPFLLGKAEAATGTDQVPPPATAEQGMMTDCTEHDNETMTTATVNPTRQPHHFITGQAKTAREPSDGQCSALVPSVARRVLTDNVSDKVEELGEATRVSGDEGTVRITIKVKVGKGSNVRFMSGQ